MAGTYCEVVKDRQSLLPNGSKQIFGTVLIGTYNASGPAGTTGQGMNLANFFAAGSAVSVEFSGGIVACKHDGGNASNGRIICYWRDESNVTNLHVQVMQTYDLSAANIGFVAIGNPY